MISLTRLNIVDAASLAQLRGRDRPSAVRCAEGTRPPIRADTSREQDGGQWTGSNKRRTFCVAPHDCIITLRCIQVDEILRSLLQRTGVLSVAIGDWKRFVGLVAVGT